MENDLWDLLSIIATCQVGVTAEIGSGRSPLLVRIAFKTWNS